MFSSSSDYYSVIVNVNELSSEELDLYLPKRTMTDKRTQEVEVELKEVDSIFVTLPLQLSAHSRSHGGAGEVATVTGGHMS